MGFAAMRVGGLDAGPIELSRRERKLISLARRSEFRWALHVQAIALAPSTRKCAINVDVDADFGTLGAKLVGGNHMIDQCFDEGRLFEVQKNVSRSGRSRSRNSRLLLRLRKLGRGHNTCCSNGCGAADD